MVQFCDCGVAEFEFGDPPNIETTEFWMRLVEDEWYNDDGEPGGIRFTSTGL
jgi:hypothetical protein